MRETLKLLSLVMVAIFLFSCSNSETSQDFETNLYYFYCKREDHHFTCTPEEYAKHEETHYGQSYFCPKCGKNDKIVRLPDSQEVIEKFKNLENDA